MNPNEGNAFLHLVTQLAPGSLVEDVDSYFAALDATHDVAPMGNSIDFEGFTLEGFEITGQSEVAVFANSRFPAPVQAAGGPGVFSHLFIGETPSGLMTLGVSGADETSATDMLPALGSILETFEFTGPGLDPALPPGELIQSADSGPPPPPLETAGDDGLPPLGAPFAPAAVGRFELVNFSLGVSLDFGDGWFVQPNFPGVVVLTHPESIGPNDRDIVFINSVVEFVPIAGGPMRAGAPVEVDDIETFLEAPPVGVTIGEIERFDLVSATGETTPVVAFDIASEAASACSPTDPCDFAFVTSYGFVKSIRLGEVNRVWWFPEHPAGPAAAVAIASADNAPWMDEATALMATLELSR